MLLTTSLTCPSVPWRAIGRVVVLSVTALLVLQAPQAFAWGKEGHQVVAELAQSQLTPKARAEVDKLLATEPGATLSSIASWADEQRDRSTAAWHYVNFPRGTCTYVPERDCKDGNCVVAAISRQLEILKSSAPAAERLTALKYLVHFVGDVHQPLHAGYADDKGGNTYQVRLGDRGTNLHSLWDSGLLRTMGDPAQLTASLLPESKAAPVDKLDPKVFAEESCKVVQADGFYPDRFVDEAYQAKFTPVIRARLAAAGARLAAMLNKAWP